MLEIAGTSQVEDAWEAGHSPTVERLLEEYNKRGFAWSAGGTEAHISAIALPLIVHSEAVGAVNILFFRSAMTIEQCAERFLDTFRASMAAMQVKIETDAEVEFNP